MKILFWFLLFVACICRAYTVSGNVYTTDGSESDTQSAVNACPAGGIVQLPSGTFSWSGTLTIGQSITLQGSGYTPLGGTSGIGAPGLETTINYTSNANTITVSSASTGGKFRITGIYFTGISANNDNQEFYIEIDGSKTSDPYRIDNCVFNSGDYQVIDFNIWGNGPGLIDHCTFNGGGGSEFIHNNGMGPSSMAGWQDDINPGTAAMLYIENCYCNNVDSTYIASFIESYYGARTCVRYCTTVFSQLDQHGTQGLIGARWFEFYNNTFIIPQNYGQSNFMALRGGSGVVFNNVGTGGPNEGTADIQMYDENGGTTPAYLGRGINQTYSPVYLWNNTQNIVGNSQTNMPVDSTSSNVTINAGAGSTAFSSATEPSSMIIEETAAQEAQGGTTYVYQPYVYPHPLDTTTGGSPTPTPAPTTTPTPSAPAAPTNLRITSSPGTGGGTC